jgi:HEAT repeat protein
MRQRLCVILVSALTSLISLLPAEAARPLKTDRHVSVNPLNAASIQLDEKVIKKAGYDPHEINRVLDACRAKASNVRYSALAILTDRAGEQAIPVLAEALDDSSYLIRMAAARLLRLMGDTRGLARMRKDYADILADGARSDPNLAGLSGRALERAKQKMQRKNLAAMNVARILAEFEDHSGFELAAKLALSTDEEWVYALRIYAARVLVEIAMDDPNVLKAENRDPEPVLVAMAASEKDPRVLTRLAGSVYGCRLRNDLSIHVVEKIVTSPYLEEKDRREAVSYLEAVKERAAKRPPVRHRSANDPNAPSLKVTPVEQEGGTRAATYYWVCGLRKSVAVARMPACQGTLNANSVSIPRRLSCEGAFCT